MTPTDPAAGPSGLCLRELRLEDWPVIHEWCRREDVTQYQPWGPNTAMETRDFVVEAVAAARQTPRTRHVLTAAVAGTVVGLSEITLRGPGSRVAEFGYAVHPKYWRLGYGSRIAFLAVDHAFRELGMHRVEAHVDTTNTGSVKVLESLQMHRDGTLRSDIWLGSRWRDSHVYSLLETEWVPGEDSRRG